MKLTKENVYVNLQGKTKEELTDLWEFLNKYGENQFRKTISGFLNNYDAWIAYEFSKDVWQFSSSQSLNGKTEVTIEQLKKCIMETKFTPIAMKCTQEQFDGVLPKLKGIEIKRNYNKELTHLVNNLYGEKKVGLVFEDCKKDYNRTVYEEWNEEIFLKACGIDIESLEQQLQKAEAEVRRLKEAIEEENKPKVGDWVINEYGVIWRCKELDSIHLLNKIKDQELINKLNELIK